MAVCASTILCECAPPKHTEKFMQSPSPLSVDSVFYFLIMPRSEVICSASDTTFVNMHLVRVRDQIIRIIARCKYINLYEESVAASDTN